AGALLCNGMTCMQAALIAWITIRLWTHFLAYNPALEFASSLLGFLTAIVERLPIRKDKEP
ncbi:MAG: hypothetical protein E6760_06910, partial [Eggerthella sp.]|nr:hypothetical protein [Eggerthella sp.]